MFLQPILTIVALLTLTNPTPVATLRLTPVTSPALQQTLNVQQTLSVDAYQNAAPLQVQPWQQVNLQPTISGSELQ